MTPNYPVITDQEIAALVAEFVRAAQKAYEIGFDFVDLKHCHGYLGHELLSAYTRPGDYGGSFENRTRFLRELVDGIRHVVPDLILGVRLSAFDFVPFRPGGEKVGEPVSYRDTEGRYPFAFGCSAENPTEIDLDETIQFLESLETLDIQLVNLIMRQPLLQPPYHAASLLPTLGWLPATRRPLSGCRPADQ